jgi:hypothetical protein
MNRTVCCLLGVLLGIAVSTPLQAANRQARLWSKLTTLGVIRGRWLTPEQYRIFRTTTEPDDVVGCFNAAGSRALVAVALQSGFKAFLDARSRPGESVAVAELNVEIICKVNKRTINGGIAYQPTFVVRLTRLPPAGGGPPGGPGAPPPAPLPRP